MTDKKPMMVFFFFILFEIAFAQTSSPFDVWEKKMSHQLPKDQNELFKAYETAGDYSAEEGLFEKSISYYKKAIALPVKDSKANLYLKLLLIVKDNKKLLTTELAEARKWFTKNPEQVTPEISELLKLFESHVSGNTIVDPKSPLYVWAREERIKELMIAGDAAGAWLLVREDRLESADILAKTRFDLLATAALPKGKRPSLLCESTLNRSQQSFAFTLRICRYLLKIRGEKKNTETADTIQKHIETYDPDKIFWMPIIRKL